jgi:hypothetical protein
MRRKALLTSRRANSSAGVMNSRNFRCEQSGISRC